MSYLPLVSIILPAFNAEKFIRKSVLSLVHQSYSNLEILILDDGSTDQTLSILKDLANRYPAIKLYSRPNGGLVSGLNYLISMSSGAFIARMDADDESYPHRIEHQIQYMLKNNIDVCGSFYSYHSFFLKRLCRLPVTNSDIRFALNYMCPLAHPTVIIKASLLKSYLYRDYYAAEDYDLWVRLAVDPSVVFSNIPIDLLYYRRHPLQLSKNFRSLFKSASLLSSNYRRIYFSSIGSLSMPDLSIHNATCIYTLAHLCVSMYNLSSKDTFVARSIVGYFFASARHFKTLNYLESFALFRVFTLFLRISPCQFIFKLILLYLRQSLAAIS